jgi:aspartate aminotransferase/aminotransferase
MPHAWIADRATRIDSSGIRKVFDLAARLSDPINLSIGQPDFEVPQPIQEAAIAAIRTGKNGYTATEGVAALRDALQARVDAEYGRGERKVLVTSGTSGGLVLAIWALVNPEDEVIVFDPYFVMYEALVKLVGGRCILIDTYPDFRLDVDRVAQAITPKTKMILLGTPANPTGVVATEDELRGLAELADRHGLVLVSDEIYRAFCYDQPMISPARLHPQALVLEGFSKTYAVTGWRVGFAHGPARVIETMAMLQQYTFVCAPQPAQWGALAASGVDMADQLEIYRARRDRLLAGLSGSYEVTPPGGAFYVFPRVPRGTGTEWVERAIEHNLLVIPGKVFSRRDTHFRISYAADERTIDRGIEVLRRLADG